MNNEKAASNRLTKPLFFSFLDRISVLPFHPFLFAAFPVLDLLGHNIEEIRPVVAIRALVFCLVLCAFLLFVFRWLFKDWDTAAVGTTGVLILLFSYGNVYSFLKGLNLAGGSLVRHRIFAPVWLAALVIFIWWLARKRNKLRGAASLFEPGGSHRIANPLSSNWRVWLSHSGGCDWSRYKQAKYCEPACSGGSACP